MLKIRENTDYVPRVFSKGSLLYEIFLNISTPFRPVHCVSFYKRSKDQVSTRPHRIDKGKKSAKDKRNCPPFFETLLRFNHFECKAFFTRHVELMRTFHTYSRTPFFSHRNNPRSTGFQLNNFQGFPQGSQFKDD